ncbi:hypothetical protein GB927_033275 [Shinella sp. CPCC 100929]|uniref:Transposase n=1 Tax=Shinella lacus TaxID=2654216 RepID=A0ABT1RII8_9HYPH|nr:hypothetical protein [Shinella lacus]
MADWMAAVVLKGAKSQNVRSMARQLFERLMFHGPSSPFSIFLFVERCGRHGVPIEPALRLERG